MGKLGRELEGVQIEVNMQRAGNGLISVFPTKRKSFAR